MTPSIRCLWCLQGKNLQPPNYEKERAYFQEVDSIELIEESPSPKKSGTWAMGIQNDDVGMPHMVHNTKEMVDL